MKFVPSELAEHGAPETIKEVDPFPLANGRVMSLEFKFQTNY